MAHRGDEVAPNGDDSPTTNKAVPTDTVVAQQAAYFTSQTSLRSDGIVDTHRSGDRLGCRSGRKRAACGYDAGADRKSSSSFTAQEG